MTQGASDLYVAPIVAEVSFLVNILKGDDMFRAVNRLLHVKEKFLMENFKAPVPVEYSNQLVLLTAQLAEYYECEPRHISDNFKRNESRFVEGKHYFRLEGEALKQFKDCSAENGLVGGLVGLRASSLYLWTERGAARHAKMLSTDKAWDVFEQLEDCYFSRHSSVLTAAAEPAQLKSSKRSEGQKSPARVYVALMEDNSVQVKLGQSKNVLGRITDIERETKLNVKDFRFTPLMPRDKARLIEGACKKIFASRDALRANFILPTSTKCGRQSIASWRWLSRFFRRSPTLSTPKKFLHSPTQCPKVTSGIKCF